MRVVVANAEGAESLAVRFRAELPDATVVIGEPGGDDILIVTEPERAFESTSLAGIVFGYGPLRADRAYWLERDIEWVPEGAFDELVARCRRAMRTAASVRGPERPNEPREAETFMTASRASAATFQIVSQVCADSRIAFYRHDGDRLVLAASTVDGFSQEVSTAVVPAEWAIYDEPLDCEVCQRAPRPLVGDRGACLVVPVESDTRHYGILVVVTARGMVTEEEREAISNAAKQLGYGLEAEHLLNQVRTAYGSLRATRDQLVHAEKFAAVGLLAAEIAHEINNPASFVITNLSVLGDYAKNLARFHAAVRAATEEGIDSRELAELEREHEVRFFEEDIEALVRRSLAGLERIHQIVQDLRYTSNVRSTSTGWVNVERLIESAMGLVRHEAKFRTEMRLDFEGVPMVKSDPNRLSQVFLNLLMNAVQAIPPGSVADNLVEVSTRASDGWVAVAVRDTGVGVSEDDRSRIFEPFYTTKPPGDGTGLGLSISRDIVRGLGGDLTFDSEPGSGSTFHVKLPAAERRGGP